MRCTLHTAQCNRILCLTDICMRNAFQRCETDSQLSGTRKDSWRSHLDANLMCANAFNLIIIMAQCQTERKRLWRILCAVVANIVIVIVIIFYFGFFPLFFPFSSSSSLDLTKFRSFLAQILKCALLFIVAIVIVPVGDASTKPIRFTYFQEMLSKCYRFGLFTLCICFRKIFVCSVINVSIVYCFYLFC